MIKSLLYSVMMCAMVVGTGLSLQGMVMSSARETEAWLETCELIEDEGYTCNGIDQPLVVYTDLSNTISAGKYSLDTKRITLDDGADLFDAYWYVVLVHEMAHYIHASAEGWESVDMFLACWMEDVAFTVSNAAAVRLDRPELASPNWWLTYPACWYLYADGPFLQTIESYQ